jgi:hypothetical protein
MRLAIFCFLNVSICFHFHVSSQSRQDSGGIDTILSVVFDASKLLLIFATNGWKQKRAEGHVTEKLLRHKVKNTLKSSLP